MKILEKIKQFNDNYQDKLSISENMISQDDKIAKEIIDDLLDLVEDQHKAILDGLVAIGDNAIYQRGFQKYDDGLGGNPIREMAKLLCKDKDVGITHQKKMENSFYTLQKLANKKIDSF